MEPLVPDDHDKNEDASYAEFRFTFFEDGADRDDEGNPKTTLGQIESHFHHINESILVDALLVTARTIVAGHMGENMFNERVPEEVRNHAANMLATNWLTNRLNSGELQDARPLDFSIPDDASELFEN